MTTSVVPTARVLIGSTSVPEGPHKEFPRQLVEQFEHFARTINNIRIQLEETQAEGSPVGYFPRVKAGGGTLPTTAAPYEVSWEEKGTVFDDVGAAAATEWQLPNASDYDGNLDVEAPWFRFVNTSGQILRVRAGASETIRVDVTNASVAGGAVELPASNSGIEIVLIDDQWRAAYVRGEYRIVA